MTSKYTKLIKYIGDADLSNFVAMCSKCHSSFNITTSKLSDYSQVFVVPEYFCYAGAVTCPDCGQETIVIFNSLEDTRFFPVYNNTTVFPRKFIEKIGNLIEKYSPPHDEVIQNYSSFNVNVLTSAILNALWEQILIASNQNVAKKNEIKEMAYVDSSTYKHVTLPMLSRIIENYPLTKPDEMLKLKDLIAGLLCCGLDEPTRALKFYKLFLTLNKEIRKGTVQFT